MKPKVLVILGPTATGKSDLGVTLARKFDGEVISADSRQVYKGMNLGTGKITKKEMDGVPHHLLDVANPKKVFSVSDYSKLASKVLDKILEKNKLPIVVGGTGFYIDTLLNDVALPEVPPNKTLRKDLEKKDADQLFLILKKLDPSRAKNIDAKNKVRLVRAIEIAKALGKVPKLDRKKSPFKVLYIGLAPDEKILKEQIHSRLLSRIKKGMINEIKKLHENGLSWKRLHDLGLEYRFVAEQLQGKISKKEMVEKLEQAIWQYTKRQKTWFKLNKDIHWFDPKQMISRHKLVKLVKTFVAEK